MSANHNHAPVEVDPAALEHAKAFWHGFTNFTKYGVIAVVILLLAMFFFLL